MMHQALKSRRLPRDGFVVDYVGVIVLVYLAEVALVVSFPHTPKDLLFIL